MQTARFGHHERKPRKPHAARFSVCKNAKREHGFFRNSGLARPGKFDIPKLPKQVFQGLQSVVSRRNTTIKVSKSRMPIVNRIKATRRTFFKNARHFAIAHGIAFPVPKQKRECNQKSREEQRPKNSRKHKCAKDATGRPIPSGFASSHEQSSCKSRDACSACPFSSS